MGDVENQTDNYPGVSVSVDAAQQLLEGYRGGTVVTKKTRETPEREDQLWGMKSSPGFSENSAVCGRASVKWVLGAEEHPHGCHMPRVYRVGSKRAWAFVYEWKLPIGQEPDAPEPDDLIPGMVQGENWVPQFPLWLPHMHMCTLRPAQNKTI